MRYISEEQLRTYLSLGKSVEQWLKPYEEDGFVILKWITIVKESSSQFNVFCMEVLDEGDLEFHDVYSFSSKDPDEIYCAVDAFETIEHALEFAVKKYEVSLSSFVNAGVIQDIYRDYLLQR